MSNNHIFISYSRADAEFAQKVAEDLRAHGVNIWLDKIDIPVGSRWDRAVEEALETCGRLLLVMSPTSVGSENVMDEISEAFQNNKQIIPILHQPCEVPMRIRRLQYIDFTKDYNTAFTRLIQVVSQDATPSKPVAPASVPQRQTPVESPQSAPSAPSFLSRRRNLLIGIAAALFFLFVLLVIFTPDDEMPTDQAAAPAHTGEPLVEAILDCRDEANLKAPADTSTDATIKFINHKQEGVTIYAVDTSGKWFEEGKLAPNEEKTFETHAGHIWQVADPIDNCLGLYKMAADQNSVEIK